MEKLAPMGSRLSTTTHRAPTGDEGALEHLLQQAHVHVVRYYRWWIPSPDAQALIDPLAEETLVRIARMDRPAGDEGDAEVIASWLSVARDVALEVIGG
jgi:hypothetical protein